VEPLSCASVRRGGSVASAGPRVPGHRRGDFRGGGSVSVAAADLAQPRYGS
jgi:hypothetical protein